VDLARATARSVAGVTYNEHENGKYLTLGLQIFWASPSVSTFALNAQASKNSPRPVTRFDGRAVPLKDKTGAGALKSLGRFFTFWLYRL
jgi:hypothetical protein